MTLIRNAGSPIWHTPEAPGNRSRARCGAVFGQQGKAVQISEGPYSAAEILRRSRERNVSLCPRCF